MVMTESLAAIKAALGNQPDSKERTALLELVQQLEAKKQELGSQYGDTLVLLDTQDEVEALRAEDPLLAALLLKFVRSASDDTPKQAATGIQPERRWWHAKVPHTAIYWGEILRARIHEDPALTESRIKLLWRVTDSGGPFASGKPLGDLFNDLKPWLQTKPDPNELGEEPVARDAGAAAKPAAQRKP
jgi:hypothetical protein